MKNREKISGKVKLMKRKVVLENRWLKLLEDKYQLGNGEDCTYYHVERSDAVMAIALENDNGRIYTHIVSQYRHPIGKNIWQFPLGGIDSSELSLEKTAIKELNEETGVLTSNMECVGSFFTDPGFTNQKMHVCVSSDIQNVQEQKLDNLEYGLVSKRVEFNENGDFLSSNQMQDAWSICGYHFIQSYIQSNRTKFT